MASTYLSRTLGTPTNAYKGTLSWWQKGMNTSSSQYILACESGSERQLWYGTSGKFQGGLRGTSSPPDIDFSLSGTPRFRDTLAWYHCVLAWDTTLSTASDRYKYYVNGVEFTISGSGSSSTIPQNHVMPMNKSGLPFRIGSQVSGGSYFEGIMSHIHFCDGTQYQASDFGETDSTTGEWKIKIDPSVTYGNNGFWWLKDTNAATDSSPNSNTPTIGGTLTKTEDCPSNVFATWNPLNKYWSGGTYSWGNNKIVLPNNDGAWNTGTLGMTSGKYYWEVKVGGDHNGTEVQLGIADKSPIGNAGSTAGKAFGYSSNGEYGIYVYNGAFIGNAVANPYTSYGSGAGDGYIMIAVDLDNNKFYGGANGTWFGSGNPSNGTNGKTIQAVADTVDGVYYPAVSTFQGYSGTVETNFGNGYFADNAVSSAGTNASGNGIFEYDVPTGYTALSTKGLNE